MWVTLANIVMLINKLTQYGFHYNSRLNEVDEGILVSPCPSVRL